MEKEIKNEFQKINKSITDLAVMTARGFEEMVTKKEFTEFKSEMTEFQAETKNSFRSLRNDVWEISDSFVDENEFEDLSLRVKYVGTKLGIESGK